MPARAHAKWMHQGDDNVVSDLDAILTDTVTFRIHGKVHQVKPISVENFLVFTNALAKLHELRERNNVSPEELMQKYYQLFQTVCDTITLKDIQDASFQQIAGLFSLLISTVQGKAQAAAETNKKKLKTQ